MKAKEKRGITLVALVVTIIVLIILAGISISLVLGENGILQKARDAKTQTDEEQIKERIKLAYHSALTGGEGTYTKDTLMEELKNEFETDYDVDDSGDDNWVLRAKDQTVIIPAGIKAKTAKFVDNLVYKIHSFPFSTITKIERTTSEPNEQFKKEDNIVSAENSDFLIYMWEKNNILYWYSEIEKPELPENCKNLLMSFTQLENASGITDWNARNVIDMSGMFGHCSNLKTLDISSWNTGNVTDMSMLFIGCSKLQSIDLSNWNTNNVTNLSQMFAGCSKLQSANLSNWSTNNVTDLSLMFQDCTILQSVNIANLNTNNVVSMAQMFNQCKELTNLNLSGWNTNNVTNMHWMFLNCQKLQKIVVSSNFIVDNVTNSEMMFGGCYTLVGENGTTYNDSDNSGIDKTMAHIDVEGNPGYFSSN